MMKARRTLRRTHARGFTLMELMVVVILVAVLAGLAAPSMVKARNDRITFDYARQTSELFHAARSRAAGRGAAHLVVFSTAFGGGSRGSVVLYEALDGTAAPSGPNPLPSCRAADFTYAKTFVPGAATTDPLGRSAVVDALNINAGTGTVQDTEDIRMAGSIYADDGSTKTTETVIGLCITPNGTSYAAAGATIDTVLTDLASAAPFTNIIEVEVARHISTNTVVGLKRRVLIGSGGQPRIKSQ